MKRIRAAAPWLALSFVAWGGDGFESSGAAPAAGAAGGVGASGGGGASGASAAGKGGNAGASGASGGGGASGGPAAGASGASGGGGASGASGSGAAGGGASGAGGTAGGAGKSGGCVTKLDCPPPAGTCQVATCTSGVCGVANAPAGPLGIAAQLPGDCQVVKCDGSGNASQAVDLTDVPADDGNACTVEVCKGATPTHEAAPAGEPCGASGVCNGAGKCGVCKPGARRCVEGGAAECDASGQWGAPVACGAAQPVCSEGACVAAVAVSAGKGHSCARLSDGSVRCWGLNDAGQCGVAASKQPVVKPVVVGGAAGALDIAAGAGFTCARLAKAVLCWGTNDAGQLGDGTTSPRPSPAKVLSLGAVDAVVAGDHHACALDGAAVRCWGGNDLGQLAATGVVYAAQPVTVPLMVAAETLSAGFGHACVGAKGAGIWCWGANDQGQLGRKSSDAQSPTPQPVVAFAPGYLQDYSTVERLFSGPAARHALAQLSPGQVAIWGSNAHGEAGYTGAPKLDGAAYFIDQAKTFSSISAGAGFNCSLVSGGAVRCNGANDVGQLGRGTVGVAAPNVEDVGAPLPGGATSVAAGERHACAVAGGDVYCWGANDLGQLGGGAAPSAVPRAVTW